MANHLDAIDRVTLVTFHLIPARILEQMSLLNDKKKKKIILLDL